MKRKIIVGIFFLFPFISPLRAQEQGIIINEFSNGASGTKEYIEFLVVGCSGSRVDIRGWKFDDNNGDFSNGPITSAGIAPGHSRFSMHTQWSSVPVGALILVYNKDDKNSSITLPDDPSDSNTDSVYVLSHNDMAFIETCNATPTTGDATYSSCTVYNPGGLWTTVGMRNQGDATQVRRPDGTYFHGFGWGDGTSNNTGGPDNLFFPGPGGTRAYSYTSSSCNYRDISNFSSQSAPAGETPGSPNNASNLNYIRFLREGITPGTISGDQTICTGVTPSTLTESGSVIRCYVSYQWQSSTTGTIGSYSNIAGAQSAYYSPPSLTTTTYYRRVVTNICESDTSNVIIINILPAISRADQPSVAATNLCMNAANSNASTNAVSGATGYAWEIFPPTSGTITGSSTSATIDWNDTYSGIAKIVVKSLGCGGGVASDTTFITISSAQPQAGADQLAICATSTILAAGMGTGTWSIVSGSGGNFTNASLYNTGFSGLAGETYLLQWDADVTSCTSAGTDDVQISFAVVPGDPQVNDTASCSPGSFELTASGGSPGEYRWYTSDGTLIPGETNQTYLTPLLSVSTDFYVSLYNGSCESNRISTKVTIYNTGQIDAGPNINTIRGEEVLLQGSGNGSIQWSPPDGLSDPAIANPTASPDETTTYVLTVVTADGCILKDSITIHVLCDQVRIPNLITPNGDDKNDSFFIGCTESLNWKLEISNRWGDIVYLSSHYNNEWKAEGLSDGVYYFHLSSEILNVSYKGWVEVLN